MAADFRIAFVLTRTPPCFPPMPDAAKRRRALACKYEGTSRRNEQRGYAATRRIRAGKDIL